MGSILSNAAALFITVPLFFYLLIFVFVKQVTKNHRKAFSIAVHLTTVLLIASVHFLIIAIWSQSYFFLIVLFMLVLAMIFTFLHWKMREEIIYSKVFIGYWRFNFLVFSILYISLLIYGVSTRAIDSIKGV